ncbi:MAG: polysaccharide deacetylase family protein [Solirubrobacterales bacterium]|nr:polysaccharide deacetylase family protein [Solirubrobacterales bacterium]
MPTTPSNSSNSSASQHRRRRLIALGAGAAVAIGSVAIVAVSVGSPGTWNPQQLEQGAAAEKPKMELEAQARAAAVVIAKRKDAIKAENAAIDQVIQQSAMISQAGPENKEVALTFDDGPSSYTGAILDTLKKYHASATFFTLGNQVSSFPLAMQRAVAEGHVVGNHTWDHQDLTRLGPKDIRDEMSAQIDGVTGKKLPAPKLFRPPYGAVNDQIVAEARHQGMLTVLWSVDTNDYKLPAPDAMTAQVLAEVQPGAIVLMHDGGGDRTTTSAALPMIIKGLRKAGYKMVTVPQLLLDNPPGVQQNGVARTPVA